MTITTQNIETIPYSELKKVLIEKEKIAPFQCLQLKYLALEKSNAQIPVNQIPFTADFIAKKQKQKIMLGDFMLENQINDILTPS